MKKKSMTDSVLVVRSTNFYIFVGVYTQDSIWFSILFYYLTRLHNIQ